MCVFIYVYIYLHMCVCVCSDKGCDNNSAAVPPVSPGEEKEQGLNSQPAATSQQSPRRPSQ